MVIRPPANYELRTEFTALFKKIVREQQFMEKTTPSRVLYLRPSQMPYCAVGNFVSLSTHGLNRTMDFGSAYYTSVGTTVHEVMQNFMCRSGKFLADYECRQCGKWHRLSYKHECCDFPARYHELTIDYKGIKGHIDCIYKDKKGRLWIIDFKTTSSKAAPQKEKNPGISYQEQIEIYAVLFELQYGLKISGFSDMFLVRDNPMTNTPPMYIRQLTDDKRREVIRKLNKYKKMHKAVMNTRTLSEALSLLDWGRCQDPYCRVCSEKSDQKLRDKIRTAYRRGKKLGYVPIKEYAKSQENR